jgi:trk system potassium uptake protein TrkH
MRAIVPKYLVGYLTATILGWLCLQLPLFQKTALSGLDSLFMAVSAISSAGLATVDISSTFSFLGQLILAVLIQSGGIAYLVLSSFLFLSVENALGEPRAKEVLRPLKINTLIKRAILYTAIWEILGAILLFIFFQRAGEKEALWHAIFHSIASFCTAGLSVFPNNFGGYSNHLGVNVVISILSLLGAVGFFLWTAILERIAGARETGRIVSRIYRAYTFVIILLGSCVFLLTTSGHFEELYHITVAFFHTITAVSTAGFNTVDLKILPSASLILLVFLMLYGGILTGSCLVVSEVKFPIRKRMNAQDQQVFVKKMQVLSFTCFLYLILLLVSSFLLVLSEKSSFLPVVFEAASALGSVGLSVGITSALSPMGKWIIMTLMLFGRTGILIFSFTFASRFFLQRTSADQEFSAKLDFS